jgi:hypothetical protein
LRRRLMLIALTLLVLSVFASPASPLIPHPAAAALSTVSPTHVSPLPLAFETNLGQDNAAVRFKLRGAGGTVFFRPNEVVLALRQPTSKQRSHDPRQQAVRGQRPALLRLTFLGANRAPSLSGTDRLPGVANYLIGKNPNKWHTNIATYAGIVYQQLYDGIDLQFDGSSGKLKSTYTIAPGADPSRLNWRYNGSANAHVDDSGNLVVTLPTTNTATTPPTLTELAPQAWQIINGRKVAIDVKYVVSGDGRIGFALGAYDRTLPLIIDPTLIYTTPFGASQYDEGNGIAVDGDGDAYIVGTSYADTIEGSLIDADAFVASLSQDGSSVRYTTYIGGSENDEGLGIAVDNAGGVYATGRTRSDNLWTSSDAFDSTYNDDSSDTSDAFVVKLNATTGAQVYGSYLGTLEYDSGNAIAVAGVDDVYIAGATGSPNAFPTLNAYQATHNGEWYLDAFVTHLKLNLAGSAALQYSTYLGGSGADQPTSIALGPQGTVYITGITDSTDLPQKQALATGYSSGYEDAFAAKLDPAQTGEGSLVYSTYLGEAGWNRGMGIAVDSQGNAYVTGPLLDSANYSSFVKKLGPAGNSVVYRTTVQDRQASAIAVDAGGAASITGFAPIGESITAFLAQLNETGSIVSDTLLTEATSEGRGIALDTAGNAYVAGTTNVSGSPSQAFGAKVASSAVDAQYHRRAGAHSARTQEQ